MGAHDSSGIKTAPHSTEAEQAILGALLMDPTAWDRIASLIGEGDFFTLDHRLIFRAFLGLIEAGMAPGPQMGAALRKLEDWWLASGFTMSKQDLLEKL